MFGCLLGIISKRGDAQTTRVAKEVELYPSTPQLSLCFVNNRVNFAQGTSSLEMLGAQWGREIRFCNIICAARVHVIQLTSKRTEISTSQSMSEQALQGQMIQGSGLQSC